MPANGPAGFLIQPSGVLLLRGELDLATVQDLQDASDEILVPGEPIILDLAQLDVLGDQRHPVLDQERRGERSSSRPTECLRHGPSDPGPGRCPVSRLDL